MYITIFTTSIGYQDVLATCFFSKKCLKTHFFFYSNIMGFLDILLFNLKNLDLRKGGGADFLPGRNFLDFPQGGHLFL